MSITKAQLEEIVLSQKNAIDLLRQEVTALRSTAVAGVGQPDDGKKAAQQRGRKIDLDYLKEHSQPFVADNWEALVEKTDHRKGLYVFLPMDAMYEPDYAQDGQSLAGADHKYWNREKKREQNRNFSQISLTPELHGIPAENYAGKISLTLRSPELMKQWEQERTERKAGKEQRQYHQSALARMEQWGLK